MSRAGGNAQTATSGAEGSAGRPGCLGTLGLLFALHAWMSVNVAIGFGPLIALLYAFMPPYAAFSLAVAVTEYWRLGLPAMALWLAMLAGTWRCRHHPALTSPIGRGLLLPILLVWAPLLSCELVRVAAMRHALLRAQVDCHQARPIWESIREADERYRQPHAWMIKDGRRHIWSYGRMGFVPDGRPPSWGGRCGQ
ncbi:hypothetical protein [Marilutibacter chinensis]|uniref:Uncharacterized protein n=1 Tax=Marilutibacter chinensis TaxID=2912247 RepID=A0ABS9HMD9_9GAMM|nr:hypothetical protein [Lysobacter chinensis]MCF7220199.1 hypothetical protein [Lysobacter chinensis]